MLMVPRNLFFFFLGLMKGHNSSSSVDIYSEPEYRDLVHREVKRAERSGQICQTLVVYRTNVQGLVVPLGSQFAGKVISLLSMSVRDTDYIGWHQHGRIIGVLLTMVRPDSDRDVCLSLKARLENSLYDGLALTHGHSIQIHTLEQD